MQKVSANIRKYFNWLIIKIKYTGFVRSDKTVLRDIFIALKPNGRKKT